MKDVAARTARFSIAALTLSLAGIGAAQAGQFGVRVLDDAGQPVAGASVCIGLEGNYSQFGALFTDADGTASTEVPNVPLVVTVSKTRFAGVRMPEPARGFNLIKEVRLSEGVPGPRCRAGSTLAGPGVPDIRIDDIDVDGSGARTVLTASVTGEPTHYRVGADEGFGDADWQRFDERMPLSGQLSEADQVYVQLRRYEGDANGWLEARSDITTVQLRAPTFAN